MAFVIKQDDRWVQLPYGEDLKLPEERFPFENMLTWREHDPAQLDARNIVFLDDPIPPTGKVIVEQSFDGGDDHPVWRLTYRDAPAVMAPDNPTLGDWRVGLRLWVIKDEVGKTTNRRDDVIAKVQRLVDSGHPLGPVAEERVGYSNNVLRSQLMTLKDAVGFTTEDVEESLWRAEQVRKGDLSGVWPLPPEEPAIAA